MHRCELKACPKTYILSVLVFCCVVLWKAMSCILLKIPFKQLPKTYLHTHSSNKHYFHITLQPVLAFKCVASKCFSKWQHSHSIQMNLAPKSSLRVTVVILFKRYPLSLLTNMLWRLCIISSLIYLPSTHEPPPLFPL